MSFIVVIFAFHLDCCDFCDCLITFSIQHFFTIDITIHFCALHFVHCSCINWQMMMSRILLNSYLPLFFLVPLPSWLPAMVFVYYFVEVAVFVYQFLFVVVIAPVLEVCFVASAQMR